MRAVALLLCAALWLVPAAAAEEPAAEAPAGEAVSAPPRPAGPPDRFGVSLDRTQPLSITSDALEAFKSDGERRLVFTENVEVQQADVRIRTDRLEAFYPPEATQPRRLIATGNVVIHQGEREASCQRATYDREHSSLICRGDARLRHGEDVVRGEVIEFDLAQETVVVTGGAAVVLHPRPEDLQEAGEVPEG